MRKNLIRIVSVFALSTGMIFSGITTSTIEAKTSEVVVEVKNLYCKICANGVRKKLQAKGNQVSSVKMARFDKKIGTAVYTIKVKEGAVLNDSEIKKVVKGAGAIVRKVDRDKK